MPTIEGSLNAAGLRAGIVVSRFNELVTRRLLEGAQDAWRRHGGSDEDLTVVWVPGAVEIPLAARHLATHGGCDAVITLGAVIRGATGHYDYVCSMVSAGVMQAGLDTGVPVVFGVLTTNTLEQALERAGSKAGNKGFEAAVAAIETAQVLRLLPGG
ncbi:MAG TPA: 6,7-dimethyl-8-ribityllumazine synthase [Trueperaceae bacterium]